MTEQPLLLGLVAERALHRDLLSAGLSAIPCARVAVAVCDAQELLRHLRETGPVACAIVWCQDERDRGLNAIRTLRDADRNLRTVAAGIDSDEGSILRYLEAGATGYLTQNQGLHAFRQLIVDQCRNQVDISPTLLKSVIARIHELRASRSRSMPDSRAGLSAREVEILGLMAEGRLNKQIATRLEIEAPTVKNHVHHILHKLGARTRREATHVATGLGLIASPARGRSPNCNVN